MSSEWSKVLGDEISMRSVFVCRKEGERPTSRNAPFHARHTSYVVPAVPYSFSSTKSITQVVNTIAAMTLITARWGLQSSSIVRKCHIMKPMIYEERT